jgi:two-component system phosphate regulon sensor histidine kinase PhoR
MSFTELFMLILVSMLLFVIVLLRQTYAQKKEIERLAQKLKIGESDHQHLRNSLVAQHFDKTLDLLNDGVIFIDSERHICKFNLASKYLLPDLKNEHSLIETSRSFNLDNFAKKLLNASTILPIELNLNGRLFHLSGIRLEDANSDAIAAVLCLRDISELQRLGRARRDFVANLSHELRTPLTAIRLIVDGYFAAHLGDKPANPELTQTLTQISNQTSTLTQIAQEMYDLSLIESGRLPMRMMNKDLQDLATEVLTRLAPQAEFANLQLVNEIVPSTLALVDEAQIQRVLTNLVHNAIKFTSKGTVTLFIASSVAAQSTPDDMLILGIRDTGVGISRDDLTRIFERFYKADRSRDRAMGVGGTGLGLAIAKHIVEAHGGKIWAESTLGKGSTFYFSVPKAI